MLPNRDTMDTKEVTLADLVEMCKDCTVLCKSKTERVLENRSRSPRGWEREYDDVAKKFQKDEFVKCFESCSRVQRQCPEPNSLRQFAGQDLIFQNEPKTKVWWQIWKKEKPASVKPVSQTSVVTEEEVAVCENAAGDFSNILFMLAHKPTKVQFHTYDPKTGDSYNPDTGEWITRNKTNSKEIAEMLVDKWNTGIHGKNSAKSIGCEIPEVFDDNSAETSRVVGRPQVVQPPEDPNVHGTVPRF